MTVKFDSEEVKRLILDGVHLSCLFESAEGERSVRLFLDDDGSIAAELTVSFDKQGKPMDQLDFGGAN